MEDQENQNVPSHVDMNINELKVQGKSYGVDGMMEYGRNLPWFTSKRAKNMDRMVEILLQSANQIKEGLLNSDAILRPLLYTYEEIAPYFKLLADNTGEAVVLLRELKKEKAEDYSLTYARLADLKLEKPSNLEQFLNDFRKLEESTQEIVYGEELDIYKFSVVNRSIIELDACFDEFVRQIDGFLASPNNIEEYSKHLALIASRTDRTSHILQNFFSPIPELLAAVYELNEHITFNVLPVLMGVSFPDT